MAGEMDDGGRGSTADSTDRPDEPPVHRVLIAASDGRLPGWAKASPARLRHAARVAGLMDAWAVDLDLPSRDRRRWRAAAWLHDALRDAKPEELRGELRGRWKDLPGPLLHGPSAAERLRRGGVVDAELLDAVAYHTTGQPEFGELGRALYLADFLEPGRSFAPARRAGLLARMPRDRERVLGEVVAARIRHLLERGSRIRPETISFWNSLPHGS